jgi:photosystem II stability/assembly factor-like uncharacterized protein
MVNSELRAATPTGLITLRIDPQNPGTIYAGTLAGVFKTTDAGANWNAVNAGLPSDHYGHLTLSTLEIDPQSTIYAVDVCCVNIFKSSDGGSNWTAVYDASRGARLYARALAIDPRNPRTVYAAGSFNQAGSCPECGNGVFQSTDGGVHWSAVNSGLPAGSGDVVVTTLAIDAQNPSTVYAGIWVQGVSARGSAVFKTTNGGGSWRNTGLTGFSRVDILAIDPQHPSTIYARAVNYAGCCLIGSLFKTANGGASWSPVSSGLPNYVTTLAIDPQNPSTVYAGSGSGVFRSTDGGTNWVAVNSGLTTLDVSTLAIDPKNPNTVYAGAPNGGVFAITFVP